MKHGQIIFKPQWARGYRSIIQVPFRFRYDPVPGITKFKGSYFGCFYKTPKSANERRQWYASDGYGRAKRNPRYLPDAWNDYPRQDRYYDSCWKKSRKVRRQWQKSLWR